MQYVDSDKLAKARQNGIYRDAQGVHHFLKAGHPMPRNWKLVEQVDSLGERQEVADAADADEAKADTEPENKAQKGPEKK